MFGWMRKKECECRAPRQKAKLPETNTTTHMPEVKPPPPPVAPTPPMTRILRDGEDITPNVPAPQGPIGMGARSAGGEIEDVIFLNGAKYKRCD